MTYIKAIFELIPDRLLFRKYRELNMEWGETVTSTFLFWVFLVIAGVPYRGFKGFVFAKQRMTIKQRNIIKQVSFE